MKTDLSHIPTDKADFLRNVTDIIVKEAAKSQEEIAFVILFGSYARGDWVHCQYQPGDSEGAYISDYDIMVIPKNACENKHNLWYKIKRKIRNTKGKDYPGAEKPAVSLFIHNVKFFNDQLKENEYFYADIKEEGIILYDSGKFKLSESKIFTHQEKQAKAKENLEDYLAHYQDFWETHKFCLNRGDLHLAAFLLHQATENLFAAISLVYVDYKQKTHDLEELEQYVSNMDLRFLEPFKRREDPESKRLFELLKDAYIKARYKRRSYIITKEELEQIADKVLHLKKLTEELCQEKMKSMV